MDKQKLHNLKNEVIKAFIAHELGETLTMSDKSYDEKLKMILSEDPSFNIYEFKPVQEDSEYVEHRKGILELEKEYLHDIESEWNTERPEYTRLPKWDGSSLVIYYTNGDLSSIVSMSDKDTGIDQTSKFRSFVPDHIDPSISFLRCECLIDLRSTDNARGKANGLVNSKYLQDDIENLATLMCFTAHDLEGNKISYDDLKSVLKGKYINRGNGIPKFIVSPKIEELTYQHGIAMYKSSEFDFQFAIDGIVYYEDNFAYKYDYIESAITKVIGINWSETEREGLFATVAIDPVEVDGAEVRNPTSNGTPNMIREGIGVGAVVEIARSGMTIPKIINVISPVEFEYPTCPHCGTKLTEDDLYGSVLKCSNKHCIGKYDNRKSWINAWITDGSPESIIKYFEEDTVDALFELLNIARFTYYNKYLLSETEVAEKLHSLIMSTTEDATESEIESIENYLGESFHFSDLQWSEMILNLPSTVNTIRREYKNLKSNNKESDKDNGSM